MMDLSSPHLVLLYYPMYAGGNFIKNCLGLSRHAVPPSRELVRHALEYPTDSHRKLQTILATLPEPKDMHRWMSDFEFNPLRFFGPEIGCVHRAGIFHRWREGLPNEIDDLLSALIDRGIDFFAHTHSINVLQFMTSVWPKARVIVLINSERFQKLSWQIKDPGPWPGYASVNGNWCSEKYHELSGPTWPSWRDFQSINGDIRRCGRPLSTQVIEEIQQFYPWDINNPVTTFDVDDTYSDWNKFKPAMQDLYQWLGYDDFDETVIAPYYQAYSCIHFDQ
jgi:hypothetical protein